jgi:threonine dehydrogenase-like Zn-dependent dehydrogenase
VMECSAPGLVGKRVVAEINLACGKCEWCARGLGRHCPNRTVLGIVKHPGAFREIIDLPVESLVVVPDSVSTDTAVFTEPVAAACEILEQVKIPWGEKVAVLGDGKLGLLISQVLKASGVEVVQFGHHRDKLRIAAKAGIETSISKKLPRAAFAWVVEATGSADALMQAVAMTKPRGTLILKSTVHGLVGLDTAPVIVNEITLVGSRCGRFAPAMKLLKQGKLNVEEMISAEYPLADAAQAFDKAGERGVMKVLLRG